jgi:hypothetical protein
MVSGWFSRPRLGLDDRVASHQPQEMNYIEAIQNTELP